MTKNSLRVQMFSRFILEGLGGTLDEDRIRSEMLTKLLVYIIIHRDKEMTVQEICESLWPDEKSDNPAGALKNLMYRLRALIKKTWGDHAFILTGRGSYAWNSEYILEVDAEDFDRLCQRAKAAPTEKAAAEDYGSAMALYKGMFMPKLAGEHWVASLSTYYHSQYLEAAKNRLGILEDFGEYSEMAACCREVLKLDTLDEDIHTAFVKGLMLQGKPKLAMEQYKHAENLLYESLGIAPSEELRRVYEDLLKQTHDQEMDIAAIERDLREDAESGAFLCEYGVFKKNYDLEIRRAGRLGISVYIGLITVIPRVEIPVDSPVYLSIISDGMDTLEDVLLGSLRSGDVISRYSGSQFIVLLPTCQYETAKMVMERIERNYYNTKKKPKTRLSYSLQEMDTLPRKRNGVGKSGSRRS
ncbi:BTAD domain-containing putative transcriptional regulator [Eubacterium sp.]|uniref:BTAD domain-containing putative transcriptional regulator n=1 Tax=Eubacterium sp. TaxID=142586 RepID=UPI002FCB0C46